MITTNKTDREIMRDAEDQISGLIAGLTHGEDLSREALVDGLSSALSHIRTVTNGTIDYQVVVNHLDENILITDGQENVLYVNPAYERNSGIGRESLLGRTISELKQSGSYFTNPVTPDVIREKKRVMKLSFATGTEKPSVVVGVPILDEEGNILYVVASNRGLSSFSELRDNYHTFLATLHALNEEHSAVKVYENSRMIGHEEAMVGNSEAMQSILDVVQKISDTNASVLITGESGTGKELVANAIYHTSRRKNKPFIKVNCSSIPATLIESELFGYEKGAFSGASSQGKKGLFEAANGGTILLDEIGDMPLEAQSKLLRVLQNSEVTRVGGTKPIKLDIRVIASTNSDLKKRIQAGSFRKDLYYRLHIIPIHIPPLRERKEDIPLLCEHYLSAFAAQYQRTVSLSKDNMNLLCSYSWPGNIRELRNIMEYLAVCCSDISHIDNSLLRGILDFEESPVLPLQDTEGMTLGEAVAQCERELLTKTMAKVRSMKEASLLLGVDTSTISRKLKQYGISPNNR